MTEGQSHDAWERARTVAAICIQPHVRKRVTPRQLMPMPWDGKPGIPSPAPDTLTPEERLKRFESIARRNL